MTPEINNALYIAIGIITAGVSCLLGLLCGFARKDKSCDPEEEQNCLTCDNATSPGNTACKSCAVSDIYHFPNWVKKQ